MRIPVAVAGLSLLVSGCGAAGPARNASRTDAPAPGADARRIEGMTEAQRNGVFYRALSDGGHDCQNVVSSRRAGERDGVPLWLAFCRDGRSWYIAITSGGYAQLLRPGPDERASDRHGNVSEPR